jgi:hypothetical protein
VSDYERLSGWNRDDRATARQRLTEAHEQQLPLDPGEFRALVRTALVHHVTTETGHARRVGDMTTEAEAAAVYITKISFYEPTFGWPNDPARGQLGATPSRGRRRKGREGP